MCRDAGNTIANACTVCFFPGRRIHPHAQAAVVNLGLFTGLGRVRIQHRHPRATGLLSHLRRDITTQVGIRGRQPVLIDQPLMDVACVTPAFSPDTRPRPHGELHDRQGPLTGEFRNRRQRGLPPAREDTRARRRQQRGCG
jgi:hypothetical protein